MIAWRERERGSRDIWGQSKRGGGGGEVRKKMDK